MCGGIVLVTRDAWPVWCKQTPWHRVTRRQWRADTGRITLFVSVNIHTTHHCCIRGVVLSPPICRGKQQWNYNESVRPALGRGWCHVYVPLCGVCLRSAISGARQELQSLVRGTASCTVMQCRTGSLSPLQAPELAAVVRWCQLWWQDTRSPP